MEGAIAYTSLCQCFSVAIKQAIECKVDFDDQFLELIGKSIDNHVPVASISHLSRSYDGAILFQGCLSVVTYLWWRGGVENSVSVSQRKTRKNTPMNA